LLTVDCGSFDCWMVVDSYALYFSCRLVLAPRPLAVLSPQVTADPLAVMSPHVSAQLRLWLRSGVGTADTSGYITARVCG